MGIVTVRVVAVKDAIRRTAEFLEANMNFQVGDQVVHWTYGPGEVIQLDEKALSGQTELYYVVQIRDMTLFVPINDQAETSLRLPTQLPI